MMPRDIPGYYYDFARNKYFPRVPGRPLPPTAYPPVAVAVAVVGGASSMDVEVDGVATAMVPGDKEQRERRFSAGSLVQSLRTRELAIRSVVYVVGSGEWGVGGGWWGEEWGRHTRSDPWTWTTWTCWLRSAEYSSSLVLPLAEHQADTHPSPVDFHVSHRILYLPSSRLISTHLVTHRAHSATCYLTHLPVISFVLSPVANS